MSGVIGISLSHLWKADTLPPNASVLAFGFVEKIRYQMVDFALC